MPHAPYTSEDDKTNGASLTSITEGKKSFKAITNGHFITRPTLEIF